MLVYSFVFFFFFFFVHLVVGFWERDHFLGFVHVLLHNLNKGGWVPC